ncbi:MAG: hypothetical protein IPK82_01670 [Polyangiaceae bacterium]|nr:hypothetical protein [Polyangiaceae bacterium]
MARSAAPAPPPAAPIPPAPAASAPAVTVFAAPSAAALDDAPTAVDPPGDRPTPISSLSAAEVLQSFESAPPAAGFAPAMMPKQGDAPAPDRAQPVSKTVDSELAAFTAVAAPPRPRPHADAPAWPGTVTKPERPKSIDPKILIGAGAFTLIAAVSIAFFAGRASSANEPGSGSGTTTAVASAHPNQVSIANHVAGALSQSLQRVARSCQIDVGTLGGRSLFEVAYRRCGPLPPQAIVVRQPPDPSLDPDPQPNADPDPPPDPTPQKPRPANNKLQKVDTNPSGPSPGAGCISGCTKSHSACTSRCGAEPKQGSQYDAYQSCLGGCLKAMSQCKMACN